MLTVAFHTNALTLRGTEVALFDYAHYNETILLNRSVVVVPRVGAHEADVVSKFRKRFPLFAYDSPDELEAILARENADVLYTIKYGRRDAAVSERVKTVVHCVFDMSDPHGQVYAAVSDFLSVKYGGRYPVVPHMVTLPECDGDLRAALDIPEDATVFGRLGGAETFDIEFAREAVQRVAERNPHLYFAFMLTQPFTDLPNVKYLEGSSDLLLKTRFIRTCDAMLHARREGETFGLACGEFSLLGRPVITYSGSEYTSHLDILGDQAIRYSSREELESILEHFERKTILPSPYAIRYNPLAIMDRFEEVFLDSPNGLPRTPGSGLERVERFGRTYWLVANDNLCANILRGDAWEPHLKETIETVLAAGDTFVDVGAAFGEHTMTAAAAVGAEGRVYSFEPQALFFKLLVRNCAVNGLSSQVRPHRVALGSATGTVRLNPIESTPSGVNLGDRYMVGSSGNGEAVRMSPLDRISLSGPIRLLKIDVQGAERHVLDGARRTIADHRPYLIVEFEEHCLRRYGYGSGELFSYIQSLGYYVVFIEYEYPSDHLCVPLERVDEFRRIFGDRIVPHDTDNELNRNVAFGISEKIIPRRRAR